MTLHVCIIGIDGSGKSTLAAALSDIISGEFSVVSGVAGENFFIHAKDDDLLAPKFHPNGFCMTARKAKSFKRAAKRFVNNKAIYPPIKIMHMLSQDDAAKRLSRKYKIDVMISDGNTLISGIGRAANYTVPASEGNIKIETNENDLLHVLRLIIDGKPIPEKSKPRLPDMRGARSIYNLLNFFHLNCVWIPDVIIYLDISPELALKRISSRGKKVREKIDHHENLADLVQTREMYTKTLNAVKKYNPSTKIFYVKEDRLSLGEVISECVKNLKPLVNSYMKKSKSGKDVLGTTQALTQKNFLAKIFSFNYIFRYFLAKFFQGAWREPFFIFSPLGRQFLKEGYSAGIMKVIYDKDEKKYGFFDSIFLGYSLHLAVYDRLGILTKNIEPILLGKLRKAKKEIRIFTAPSGFAYDLFKPLENLKKKNPELMKKISLTAADLDPHGVIEEELKEKAKRLGIKFSFIRGDITSEKIRAIYQSNGKYDIALFVGLSGWLPKKSLLSHLKFLTTIIKPGGVLVSDSFTADSYSYSGKFAGY